MCMIDAGFDFLPAIGIPPSLILYKEKRPLESPRDRSSFFHIFSILKHFLSLHISTLHGILLIQDQEIRVLTRI